MELRQELPGFRRGQRAEIARPGAHWYYRLPLGGVEICSGIVMISRYPDRSTGLGASRSHGRHDGSRRHGWRGRRRCSIGDGCSRGVRSRQWFARVFAATAEDNISPSSQDGRA